MIISRIRLWFGQLSTQGGSFSTKWGRSDEVWTPEPPPELRSPFSPRFLFLTFFTMVLLSCDE
jgi:hypothetical protein